MAILNIFTFLCSISITALILPSMVPNFSLILVIILLVSISINTYNDDNCLSSKGVYPIHGISYSSLYFPFFVLFLLVGWLAILSLSESANIKAYFGTLLIHVLFLFFIVNTKRYIDSYIRAYIYLVFIMSVSGLIADSLIAFGVIDIGSHYINLHEVTNGSFTRDASMGADSYAFPYGLGMILTGSGKLSLLGFEFYRISGWAHEPTSATLFTVPALLLLLHTDIVKHTLLKIVMIVVIATFWFFAMSIGSLLALLIVYTILTLSRIFGTIYPLSPTLSAFSIIILFIMFMLIFIEPIAQSTLLTTKFDMESETMNKAISELMWFLEDDQKTQIYYFSHMFLWSIILCFLIVIILSVVTSLSINAYTIVLLYVVLHSMKGSQENVFLLTFSFFWLYLAFFYTDSKKNYTLKH